VHKVLIEDLPTIIDLNNGFILSYTHCESDIVIVQYDGEIKLIKKIIEKKYEWDTAELISDKYVLFKALSSPDYNTCLFDVEKLKIVKAWDTDIRDSFIQPICQNKFFTGSDRRFTISEIKEDNEEIVIKEIFVTDYQGFDVFAYPLILDEQTFLTLAFDKPPNADSDDFEDLEQRNAYLVVFQC